MGTPTSTSSQAILREHGLKVTMWRAQVLDILLTEGVPLSAEAIFKKLKGADVVTVYRTLHAFCEAGLAREIHFKAGMPTFFELRHGSHHHHHIVCTTCGAIDELDTCDIRSLERTSLKQSKKFKSIDTHALEFFGVCVTCERKA